ncbi:hypothetical protein MBLNU230_g5434t1 [Neophaeotheca triangularis]
MDPLKLLSRSTKRSKNQSNGSQQLPSSGQAPKPQLFASTENDSKDGSKKRKRGEANHSTAEDVETVPDFFGGGAQSKSSASGAKIAKKASKSSEKQEHDEKGVPTEQYAVAPERLNDIERKRILREHKLKVTWLNPDLARKKQGSKHGTAQASKKDRHELFPEPLLSFRHLNSRYGVPPQLVKNVLEQGYETPTEVQLGALPVLLDGVPTSAEDVEDPQKSTPGGVDLLTVAPTGSGKTLAFMIPLLHQIAQRRREKKSENRASSAVVLAPTKELAGQITNEGRKLAQGTGLRVSQVKKGMRLRESEDKDEANESGTVTKSDILVSTPGTLQSILEAEGEGHKGEVLAAVQDLVLDEADVLLDPLFRHQTLDIWNGLPHTDLRVSLWSATMGSNIEELARSALSDRLTQLSTKPDSEPIPQAPLVRLVVGLKDSAVPNISHKLTYAATEQGKLMGLRQLLHPSAPTEDSGPALRPPFLVFTQTIERAVALHAELLYDIPAEAGGISRIAVLHSDLTDNARDSVMTRVRKGEVWVLITTDLLSRGVDFRGVNGVVNYDIPTSSAAYVHRVGRTGRAGREGGVAVTLYSKEDIAYLKPIANVIAAAQKQNGNDGKSGGLQQWLLDALPSVSKNDKQQLKQGGVKSRTAKGMKDDPKAAKKARISSKAGFVRQQENKRKGAIQGSRQRQKAEVASDDGAEDGEFGGFD